MKTAKGMQGNQEIHKAIVRDPQINKKYFISFSLLWLQCAH